MMKLHRTIFIVEDRESISEVIQDMLQVSGVEVLGIASSAKEALEKLEEITPEIILMDILLPDGSGLDVAKEVLSRNSSVKIVAMSAMGDEDARERSLDAGCVEFLQKPFRMKEILEAISKI
jgi:two-component system CitB family response regulator